MHIFSNETDVTRLDLDEVRQALIRAGVVLFRDFDLDLERFEAFAAQFSSQRILSLGGEKLMESESSRVQLVVPNLYAQALHQENGSTVNRPELLWFYCRTPARSAGETTHADGTLIWKYLSERTRTLFLSKPLKYSYSVPRESWLTEAGYLEVRTYVGKLRMAGMCVRFDESEFMHFEFVTSAVTRTRWGGELAFVNSLRGPYTTLPSFVDGTPVSDRILDEIDTVHEELTHEIAWRPRDFVLIDNTRCVHGRRAFEDPERKLYTTMSLANF